MNNRRRMTGVVTSNKMTKTVVVEITRVFRHPLYRKVVHSSKRVKAHDEIGCQIGDKVQIVGYDGMNLKVKRLQERAS